MYNNYWQEYWRNYFNWMALYLNDIQYVNLDEDVRDEHIDIMKSFAPPMGFDKYIDYLNLNNEYYMDVIDDDFDFDDNNDKMQPDPFISPEENQEKGEVDNNLYYAQKTQPSPFISPEGGKFTINNCTKMAIVRVVMKKKYEPSEFILIVDRADRRSISGYRIACEGGGRVRFKAISIDYKDIRLLECVF